MAQKAAETRTKTWEAGFQERVADIENIQCFSFDGKRNENAVMIENTAGKSATKRAFQRLENVAIIRQPE